MKRLAINHDVLTLELGETKLMVASDNSGSIGEKEHDAVRVPYEVVSYFNFRVCFMEMLAANAVPSHLILHNFNGDDVWENLRLGIAKACDEVSMPLLPITGSSESNFTMSESATGLSLVGQQNPVTEIIWSSRLQSEYKLAVIGEPLVGPEVVAYGDRVASMKTFKWLSEQAGVLGLVPVASKGIKHALGKISQQLKILFDEKLNLEKAAGPATCYIVVYKKSFENQLSLKLTDPIYIGDFIN